MTASHHLNSALNIFAQPDQRRLVEEFVDGATYGNAGALSIRGNTLYSYAEPIARKIGPREFEVASGYWSVTTSRHQNMVRKEIEAIGGTIVAEPETLVAMRQGQYEKMTTQEFDKILTELLDEMSGGAILQIPGVYEVVAEELNNDVLDEWTKRQSSSEAA